MAVNDRMIPRRGPVKPRPVKPKPKGFKKGPTVPGKRRDPGFYKEKKLPNPPGGSGKKRPTPVKPKPKGGSIRDLLYRAKPGEKKLDLSQRAREARGEVSIMRRPKLNDEKSRMDSPKKRALPIPRTSRKYKIQTNGKVPTQLKNEKMQQAYAGFLQGNKRTEQIRKDTSPITNKYKYMNMMGPAGPAPKRSPIKPKLNDMMSRKPGRITKPVMPRRGGR